jgi:hypothetical protein
MRSLSVIQQLNYIATAKDTIAIKYAIFCQIVKTGGVALHTRLTIKSRIGARLRRTLRKNEMKIIHFQKLALYRYITKKGSM